MKQYWQEEILKQWRLRVIDNYKYVIGIDKFGALGLAEKIIGEYGFTVENIVQRFKKLQ